MPAIKKIVLKNFKIFDDMTLEFDLGKNVLIGENETGKSSVLLALDLALSASRSRVETIGYEALLNQGAVKKFLAGPATLDLLPVVIVDVFLEEGDDQGLYGTQNVLGTQTDGVRMEIVPLIEEFGQTIVDLLKANKDCFPFEYYSVQFSTFAGAPSCQLPAASKTPDDRQFTYRQRIRRSRIHTNCIRISYRGARSLPPRKSLPTRERAFRAREPEGLERRARGLSVRLANQFAFQLGNRLGDNQRRHSY